MKKIFEISFSISLLFISFYYTKLASSLIKNNNPIMKEIKNKKNNYEKKSINAKISGDIITPGVNAKVVDLDKSYEKMKDYGEYNDSLYVFKEVKPVLSINDNFNKYINRGRDDTNDVALVYTVSRDDNIMDILTVLSDNDVKASFFVDGLFLENNRGLVLNMIEEGMEVEILSYNGSLKEVYFKDSLDKLKELTKVDAKYCFSDYKRITLLNLCKKYNMHTVIPTVNVKYNTYKTISNKLSSGVIFKMPRSVDEVDVAIKYIKQKGFNLKRLDEVLAE